LFAGFNAKFSAFLGTIRMKNDLVCSRFCIKSLFLWEVLKYLNTYFIITLLAPSHLEAISNANKHITLNPKFLSRTNFIIFLITCLNFSHLLFWLYIKAWSFLFRNILL